MRSFLSRLKYEANFKFLQLRDWVSELRSGDWWEDRSPDIRWWRSIFYTVVAFAAYGFSVYLHIRPGQTYLPDFFSSWIWSCWNWFFWPSIIAFWLEEIVDAGQPVENRWNPWPKKLFATYVGIIGGSLLLAFLAFVTQHKVFVKELQGQKGFVSVQEKKVELEKELAEAEGKTSLEQSESGEEKEKDEFFKEESGDEDSFFSGEGEQASKRPAWKIKWELWKLKAKEKMWDKTVGEDVSALWLRVSRASGWIWYAFLWLPTLAFFLITVFFAYGLDVLESRTVRLFGVGGKKEKRGGKKK